MWALGRGREGWSYRITDEDVLWAGRAIWGEIPDRLWDDRHALALLYAMYQRFWMLRGTTFSSRAGTIVSRPPHRAWWKYVRAYSQPVSPDWLNLGDAEEQARRELRQTTPWSGLPARVRKVVAEWAEGRRPPSRDMVGAVHWLAARDAGEADASLERRHVAGVSGNVLFCVRGSSCGWSSMPVALLPTAALWDAAPLELLSLSPSTVLAFP